MSAGYLMFAYNSGTILYGSLAVANACLIKRNCKNGLVALVTDDKTVSAIEKSHGKLDRFFDHVIIDPVDRKVPIREFQDTRHSSDKVPYLNSNRSSAFDLTPFDETLMLDVDYLMLDNTMDLVWGSAEDLMCNSRIIDIEYNDCVSRMHDMSIPVYWATAVYFQKTHRVKTLFDHMKFIKENYLYYMDVYGFNHGPYFRNDFAISIALHEMNGFLEKDAVASLPVDHIFFGDSFDEIHGYDGSLLITSEKQQDVFIPHRISRNIHVMNKKALQRKCKEIIDASSP